MRQQTENKERDKERVFGKTGGFFQNRWQGKAKKNKDGYAWSTMHQGFWNEVKNTDASHGDQNKAV